MAEAFQVVSYRRADVAAMPGDEKPHTVMISQRYTGFARMPRVPRCHARESQRPARRNDGRRVALGPLVGEADGLQSACDLADRQVRQGWAHAAPGSWKEVTRGVLVTNRAGSSTSSGYSSTASARLARASSIVGP